MVVPESTEKVWNAWTSPKELSKWIAPVAAIDLTIGGTISTNYDRKASNWGRRYDSVADGQLHRETSHNAQGQLE